MTKNMEKYCKIENELCGLLHEIFLLQEKEGKLRNKLQHLEIKMQCERQKA